MATTNLNIRTDKAIKDQAKEIFNEINKYNSGLMEVV